MLDSPETRLEFDGENGEAIFSLEKQLNGLRLFAEAIGIQATADRVVRFWARIVDAKMGFEAITNRELANQISDLQLTFWHEIDSRKMAFIQESKTHYFEQDALFGEDVRKAFPDPKTHQEIKEAGNCLAFDLNTAAVFHLMRVAEFGLRAFARKLSVPISDEDLPYQEWHDVLTAIRHAIRNITEAPPGSRKDRAEVRECYNGIMQEIEGFKDVWRNSVMHTRGSYSAPEAMGVYLRVRDFMQRLAKLLLQG